MLVKLENKIRLSIGLPFEPVEWKMNAFMACKYVAASPDGDLLEEWRRRLMSKLLPAISLSGRHVSHYLDPFVFLGWPAC